MDEFVVRLRIERWRGVKRQVLGLALAASVVPFMWLLGISGAWVLATPLVGGLLVGGSIQFLRGTAAVHQATRRLHAARQIRLLPVARIIEHKS
jgi:cellobiose-specific phosphotransferase system component IIC